MPIVVRLNRYYFYFTVKCLKEPIHIHINIDRPDDNGKSAKLWLKSNGQFEIEKLGVLGNLKDKELDRILRIANDNKNKIQALWVAKSPKPITYIDIVGKWNVNQND